MSIFPVASDSVTLDTAQVETTDVWANGFRINPVTGGVRAAFSNTVSTYNQGVPLDSSGVVCLVDSTASFPSATWSNGIPLSNQKVCLSSAASSTYSNGLPMAANGGLGGLLVPSMSLYFLSTASLDSRITFTRADAVTCATYFDSTGRMQLQGRNILTYSSTFTNAAWTKTDVTPTLGESSPLDVGYLMTEGSAGTAITYADGAAVTAGSACTASIVIKRGNTDWVRLGLYGGGFTNYCLAWFNLATGAKGAVSNTGTATGAASTITNLGGGWYRLTLSGTPDTAYTVPRIGFVAAPADSATTRVSGATYTVSAAQLELGSTANTYSATTSAANSGPRFDYDPASPAGVTGGNLWSAATLFSAGTVTASGPDVVFSGAAALVSAGQAIPSGNGKTFTVTFTITDYVSGDARFILYGSGAQLVGVTRSAAGTYTETVRLTTAGGSFTDQVRIQTVNGATLRVTGLSVQEVTFTPRGLLIEESRKNNLLHSRDMTQAAWTKTDVTPARTQVGIDGVANTACLMTQGVAGTAVSLQAGAIVTAGSTITASFVVKRGNNDWINIAAANNATSNGVDVWVNLATGAIGNVTAFGAATSASGTVVNLGGGWYRVTATCIPDGAYTVPLAYIRAVTGNGVNTRASNATYIVDCAQLEVGAFATSIIPTTTTALTRAADSASMTGTNFSSWWNATQGSFVAEYAAFGNLPSTNRRYLLNMNDAGNNRISIRATESSTSLANLSVGNGTSVATIADPNATIVSAVRKLGAAYGASDIAITSGGSTPSTTANASAPTATQLDIGCGTAGTNQINGWIRSIRYYPTRLANATLQALTA